MAAALCLQVTVVIELRIASTVNSALRRRTPISVRLASISRSARWARGPNEKPAPSRRKPLVAVTLLQDGPLSLAQRLRLRHGPHAACCPWHYRSRAWASQRRHSSPGSECGLPGSPLSSLPVDG